MTHAPVHHVVDVDDHQFSVQRARDFAAAFCRDGQGHLPVFEPADLTVGDPGGTYCEKCNVPIGSVRR